MHTKKFKKFKEGGLTALMAVSMAMGGLQMAVAQSGSGTEQQDKYQWLEDVSGERSMNWVRAENEKSSKVLQSDPRFAGLLDTVLKVMESPTRLAAPEFRNGMVYNTWQDGQHLRGILRRTTLADYLKAKPNWKTVPGFSTATPTSTASEF